MQKNYNSKNGSNSIASFFEKESMFVYDFNSLKILDANEHAVLRYGYTRDELIGMKISDLGEEVVLPDIVVASATNSKIYPKEIQRHFNSAGESWYVQLTTQKFRFKNRPVRLAIAHDIDDLVKSKSPDLRRLPRIDLERTQMPFAFIEWDNELKVRNFSKKSESVFDMLYQDVIGKPIFDLPFLDDEKIAEFRNSLDNSAEFSNYVTFDTEYKSEQGKEVICRWHNSIVNNDSGEFISIYSLIEDITNQMLADRKLRKSESKFRIMTEQSFVGIYILEDSKFTYVNPRMCEITGFTEMEFKESLSFFDLIHPDDVSRIKEQRNAWESETNNSFETNLRITSKSGRILHLKTYGSAIQNGGGQKILGVLIDQTDQVIAFDEYRSSLQSYQSLFNSISDAIYIQNTEGVFLEVNQGVMEMYGYDKDEIIGNDPSFLAAPSRVDMEDTMKRFNKALEGETQDFRWWGKRKNGDIFPKEIKLTKGRFFGEDVVIAVARDISETVHREEELRRNEKLFEQLFSNSPLGVVLLDRKSLIVQVNQSFESLFGFDRDEIKGQNIDDLIVPKGDIEVARDLSESTQKFTLTKRRKTKSGELIDVFIYGVPVILEDQPIAMFGIYMDITDRIQAEERVRESLEEKKTLLAEIHHRVKNNLAVISGLLELQHNNLKSEEAKSALRDSQMRISSMGLIHEKLYQNESLSDIDFGQYINELVGVIVRSQNKSKEDINIVMDAVPIELPIKKAIPCGLVINEIVTNSLKYAFPKGKKDPEIRITLKLDDGRAKIEISDNGIGLPVPFEELNPNSLGTLLIKTLTKQLDADLTVERTEGTKYIFSFELANE
jgi:PAS domain S-box-containing protein